eukprot:scaffold5391_cov29-Tisochrysis_lutea.AAC.7
MALPPMRAAKGTFAGYLVGAEGEESRGGWLPLARVSERPRERGSEGEGVGGGAERETEKEREGEREQEVGREREASRQGGKGRETDQGEREIGKAG